MFVEEQPGLGGSRHLRLVEVLLVLREAPVHATRRIRISSAEETENRVHGKAAVALSPPSAPLLGAEVTIGRAFVNADRCGSVLSEHTIGHPGVVRVADIQGPVHHIVDPIFELAFCNRILGLRDTKIICNAVIKVTAIQVPCQGKLFGIVQAGDSLGFGLGLAQDRQKEAGEDRNDGDHYQKFNECERPGWSVAVFAGRALGRPASLQSPNWFSQG